MSRITYPRRDGYTRDEIDAVLTHIRKMESRVIPTGQGSFIRNITGTYFNDYNMYTMFAALNRMHIVRAIDSSMEYWVPTLGYHFITGFHLYEDYYKNLLPKLERKTNQFKLL